MLLGNLIQPCAIGNVNHVVDYNYHSSNPVQSDNDAL